MRHFVAVWLAVAGLLFAQQPAAQEIAADPDFICPMDKDVRQKSPGKCPRCGMKLVAGIPDPVEYHVDLKVTPKVPRPGSPLEMLFRVEDPKDSSTVKKFDLVHDKLFHLFVISEDLQYFAHEHPRLEADGRFRFNTALPKAGAYRILSDFYPSGGTPQMHVSTLYAAGQPAAPKPLTADLGQQHGSNLDVELVMEPAQPIAGFKTLLFCRLKTSDGSPFELEQYLGAWGHMLAASEDLIDLVHTHPFIADGGPQVQFNLIFPREGIYRVWVQFQSKGKVNTAAFNIPVKQLR